MKVIIIGLGRMGTGLALNLIKKKYQVIVIDSNPDSFESLGSNFTGEKIVGVGFDKDVLTKASIAKADAVVCCTQSDETNAVIARIARTIYKVPHVISRLYDSQKANLYHRLGIQTITTTTWGIERATEFLTYQSLDSVYEIGSGHVNLVRIELPPLLVGQRVNDLTVLGEYSIVSISRNNKTFLPTMGTVLEKEDILYFCVLTSAADKLRGRLGLS